MGTLSAVVITLNEEHRIEPCLRSLDWADEIVVVDGGSRDHTVEIASRYTQKVRPRTFDDFASQKNYALGLAEGDWIFSIDADERVSEELKQSLLRVVKKGDSRSGFFVRRANVIFGRPLRFGGQASERILRVFKKGRGKFERPIHEKLIVEGPCGELTGPLIHQSSSTMDEYLRKLKVYTDLEIRWMAKEGVRPTGRDLYLKPLFLFLRRYLVQGGFLDGTEGFLYHSFSSFYTLLKYVRLKEETHG